VRACVYVCVYIYIYARSAPGVGGECRTAAPYSLSKNTDFVHTMI